MRLNRGNPFVPFATGRHRCDGDRVKRVAGAERGWAQRARHPAIVVWVTTFLSGCSGGGSIRAAADAMVVADAMAGADALGLPLPDGGLDGMRSLVACVSSADCQTEQICCGNEGNPDQESKFIPESSCQPWHAVSDMGFRRSPLCPPGLPSQLCRRTAECVPTDFACVPSPTSLAGRSVMVCVPPEEAGAGIEGCDAASYDDDGGSGTCAPHWLDSGNGCTGGYVLFPLWNRHAPPSKHLTKTCGPYCLGTLLTILLGANRWRGVNQLPWVVDAGAVPT